MADRVRPSTSPSMPTGLGNQYQHIRIDQGAKAQLGDQYNYILRRLPQTPPEK